MPRGSPVTMVSQGHSASATCNGSRQVALRAEEACLSALQPRDSCNVYSARALTNSWRPHNKQQTYSRSGLPWR